MWRDKVNNPPGTARQPRSLLLRHMWMRVSGSSSRGGTRSLMHWNPTVGLVNPLGFWGICGIAVRVPDALLAQGNHILMSHLLKRLEITEYAQVHSLRMRLTA